MIEHTHDNEKDAKNIKEILGVVSTEIPAMIKSLLASVFSEEAGRNMGKAAAAYYKELKQGGLPEEVAVKMTQDYMRTFTSLGDMLRGAVPGRGKSTERGYDQMGEEIERRIREKIEKRKQESEEEKDE